MNQNLIIHLQVTYRYLANINNFMALEYCKINFNIFKYFLLFLKFIFDSLNY
jgi:hypothetical protein